MALDKILKVALIGFIAALILSGLFYAMRTSALKSAYDSANPFNVTDSTGTVHAVQASPISGDITALVWTILAGLVWLIYVVGMVMLFVKEFKA